MSQSFSRRDALKGIALVVGAAGAVRSIQPAHADAPPHLNPSDPTAQALGYTDNAKSVDAKAFPTYQAGQTVRHLHAAAGQCG